MNLDDNELTTQHRSAEGSRTHMCKLSPLDWSIFTPDWQLSVIITADQFHVTVIPVYITKDKRMFKSFSGLLLFYFALYFHEELQRNWQTETWARICGQ